MENVIYSQPKESLTLNTDALSESALIRELSLRGRGMGMLVKLMSALESKRQAKGVGWSRSWNKSGMKVFRTHEHDIIGDEEYTWPIYSFLNMFMADASLIYRAFVDDLLADPNVRAFTFYHNCEEDGERYEGLTLSLGRKVPGERSKRDRLDIVLEDNVIDGAVDGVVNRLRIYVCPWDEYRNDRNCYSIVRSFGEQEQSSIVQGLYRHCLKHYHIWKNEESRQWDHWSARYIDYFCARDFIPEGTSFS